MHVVGGRDDIVVARQRQRFLVGEELSRMVDQPIHPLQLVFELVGVDRIAVRQIDRSDAQHGLSSGDHGFDITRLLVAVVAGQAARHVIQRMLRQNGDAVIGLLSVRRDVVAEVFDLSARKGVVHAFQFLQADHVGFRLLQPVGEVPETCLDRVDVEAGNLHRGSSAFAFLLPVSIGNESGRRGIDYEA